MKEYYTYEESIRLTEQALDLLDIKQFLRQGREVFDIVSDIEHYLIIESREDLEEFWDYLDLHEDFFKGEVFNYMTDYEFMEYCRKRYPDIRWQEEIIEKHYVM